MTGWAIYHHKPTEIEAVRVGEAAWSEIARWCSGTIIRDGRKNVFIVVDTLHGPVRAYPGDYIAQSPERRDFWPIDAKTFEASYNRAADDR